MNDTGLLAITPGRRGQSSSCTHFPPHLHSLSLLPITREARCKHTIGKWNKGQVNAASPRVYNFYCTSNPFVYYPDGTGDSGAGWWQIIGSAVVEITGRDSIISTSFNVGRSFLGTDTQKPHHDRLLAWPGTRRHQMINLDDKGGLRYDFARRVQRGDRVPWNGIKTLYAWEFTDDLKSVQANCSYSSLTYQIGTNARCFETVSVFISTNICNVHLMLR